MRAGPLVGGFYGVATTGVTEGELRDLRRATGAAIESGTTRGKSLSLILATVGCKKIGGASLNNLALTKVVAHAIEEDVALGRTTWEQKLGNDAADQAAKQACQQARAPELIREAYARQLRLGRLLASWVARTGCKHQRLDVDEVSKEKIRETKAAVNHYSTTYMYLWSRSPSWFLPGPTFRGTNFKFYGTHI